MESKTAQEIKIFAYTITPPNWNISVNPEDRKYKSGTLNICLEVLSIKEREHRLGDDFMEIFSGRVKGPMNFYPISMFKGPKTMEAFNRHDEGYIAEIPLEIYPGIDTREEVFDTLVHELAHIAVVRREAQKLGRENRILQGKVEQNIEGESNHGFLFQKAFRRMIIRTEKVFGKEITKKMWRALNVYKNHKE